MSDARAAVPPLNFIISVCHNRAKGGGWPFHDEQVRNVLHVIEDAAREARDILLASTQPPGEPAVYVCNDPKCGVHALHAKPAPSTPAPGAGEQEEG